MMFFIYALVGLFWCVVWGVATYSIVKNKGYYENWFWWGFFFGFIALIVACSKPQAAPKERYVPFSSKDNNEIEKELITNGGWKCKKCGTVNHSYTGTCSCGMSKQNNN